MSITILRFGDSKMNLKGLQSKECMVIMVKQILIKVDIYTIGRH